MTVEVFGSYPTAVAFLAGRAAEELPRRALARIDPSFPVLVGVRAVRP